MSRATSAGHTPKPSARKPINPYFFIVGAPRSGTRLLGRLVDVHPEIAVIHEARFVPGWFHHRRGLTPDGYVTAELVERLAEFSRFEQLEVNREQLERLVAQRSRVPYAVFVSELFDLHGRALGKRLVGDKSPRYVRSIPTLHELWPDARVIHLVRDGRDVALSVLSWKKVVVRGDLVAKQPTWEEDRISTVALWWERLVRLGREAGARLPPELYHEVVYEALVADPASQCEALCEFLQVPYDKAMTQDHKGQPPTLGLRKWRVQMPPEDVERFEAVAGGLLNELGYPRAFSTIGAPARRHAAKMREVYADALRARGSRIPLHWSRSTDEP